MARIRAQWRRLEPVVASSKNEAVREWLEDLDGSEVERGTYVIRLARPFTISYPSARSPVLYIGEGSTRKRLEQHLTSWISKLGQMIPQAKIDARICQPRVQRNENAYREVEADLLSVFCERYGALPLFNRNKEYFGTPNSYSQSFLSVLNPGKGKGFESALEPLGKREPKFRAYKSWRTVEVFN